MEHNITKPSLKDLIDELYELMPYHINPYNLGEMGRISTIISQLKDTAMSGAALIAEERQRQIDIEGWTNIHDSEDHAYGQMIGAAMCYAANALNKNSGKVVARAQVYAEPQPQDVLQAVKIPKKGWMDAWPWGEVWDKRYKHDVKRSLVIAGALIAAELDRLIRIEKK